MTLDAAALVPRVAFTPVAAAGVDAVSLLVTRRLVLLALVDVCTRQRER